MTSEEIIRISSIYLNGSFSSLMYYRHILCNIRMIMHIYITGLDTNQYNIMPEAKPNFKVSILHINKIINTIEKIIFDIDKIELSENTEIDMHYINVIIDDNQELINLLEHDFVEYLTNVMSTYVNPYKTFDSEVLINSRRYIIHHTLYMMIEFIKTTINDNYELNNHRFINSLLVTLQNIYDNITHETNIADMAKPFDDYNSKHYTRLPGRAIIQKITGMDIGMKPSITNDNKSDDNKSTDGSTNENNE